MLSRRIKGGKANVEISEGKIVRATSHEAVIDISGHERHGLPKWLCVCRHGASSETHPLREEEEEDSLASFASGLDVISSSSRLLHNCWFHTSEAHWSRKSYSRLPNTRRIEEASAAIKNKYVANMAALRLI